MEPTVGQAYRGPDGVVRWIIAKSRRGYFHFLWLSEPDGIWNVGARFKRQDWPTVAGDIYPTPKPGETYQMRDVYGVVAEYVAWLE